MDSWLTNKKVAALLGVGVRTVFRWSENPEMGFPRHATIGGRRYFSQLEIEVWRAARMSAAGDAPCAGRGSLGAGIVEPDKPEKRSLIDRSNATLVTGEGV